MARKKSNKIEPAVQKIFLQIPSWDGVNQESAKWYCDLSQIASLVNRRFYRQGLNWAVSGITLHSPAYSGAGAPFYIQPNTAFGVSKLPNTWVLSNSWEKSMRAWLKMNNEAMSETESVRPKFMDYKIYANEMHHTKGFGANLLPALTTPGDWAPSVFQIPDSTSPAGLANGREIIAVGGNYPGAGASGLDAVSMIEGYAASRALPDIQDPNVPTDFHYADGPIPANWLQATFNEGTEQTGEVLDDLAVGNRIAPYPFEGDPTHIDTMYPGGANQSPYLELMATGYVTSTTIGGTTRFAGSNVPCGLLEFHNQVRYYDNPELSGNPVVQMMLLEIDLIPGNHRGYLCEPMTEM